MKKKKLTLEIDYWMHKELKDYLLSLDGVFDVTIQDEGNFFVHIEYNPDLISTKILKVETLLFLDALRMPCLVSFDKHATYKTKSYNIIIKDLCCEFCFRGFIDDLFMIDGIVKAESQFIDEPYQSKQNVTISIFYNPELINEEEIKKLEIKFNS